MPIYLEYAIARSYKKICGFSGLRPMRPCVSGDISRASSRIFPATPIRACLMAGWKAANTKSPPLAVKKVRLRRYKKRLPYFLSAGVKKMECWLHGWWRSAVCIVLLESYRTTTFSFKPHFYIVYSALAWCLCHIFETFLLYFWFLFVCNDMVFSSKHQHYYWLSVFERHFWQTRNRSVYQFHQFM